MAANGATTCSVSRCSAGWARTWPPANSTADWAPEVLHAHDWHAAHGLRLHVGASGDARRPRSSPCTTWPSRACSRSTTSRSSGLPMRFMQSHGLEFHGQLSFMKAGLKYAQRITTVSPTYAGEIATHEFGCGLDGVIRSRGADVSRHPQRRRRLGLEPGEGQQPGRPLLARRTWPASRATRPRCRRSWAWRSKPRRTAVRRGQPPDGAEGPGPGAGRPAGAAAQRRAAGCCRARGDPVLEAAFTAAAFAHPAQVAVQHRLRRGAWRTG